MVTFVRDLSDYQCFFSNITMDYNIGITYLIYFLIPEPWFVKHF